MPAVTVSVPFLTPVEVGVNRTVIEQLLPGMIAAVQVFAVVTIANCPASADVAPATEAIGIAVATPPPLLTMKVADAV